jgi:hypothetical protein
MTKLNEKLKTIKINQIIDEYISFISIIIILIENLNSSKSQIWLKVLNHFQTKLNKTWYNNLLDFYLNEIFKSFHQKFYITVN